MPIATDEDEVTVSGATDSMAFSAASDEVEMSGTDDLLLLSDADDCPVLGVLLVFSFFLAKRPGNTVNIGHIRISWVKEE